MKKFIKKYFFFLKKENQEKPVCIIIISNYLLFLFQIIGYYYLVFCILSLHEYNTINSILFLFPLIKSSALWAEIKYFKEYFPTIIQKYKSKDFKYEELEVFIISTTFIYILIIFNWLFVVDREILKEVGIIMPVLFCIIFNCMGLFNYIRNKRIAKERSNNFNNKKNRKM